MSTKFNVSSTQYRAKLLTFSALGVTGVSEIQQVTCPAVAAATQADYFIVENMAGETAAVWLDIDAAGTEPTGAAYLAADYQLMASVSTGDTAAQVKTAVVLALGTNVPTLTAVSNGTATLSITSSADGNIPAPVRHNEDDSGNGSFTVSTLTGGNASAVSLVNGKFDGVITENSSTAGDYLITFNEPFVMTPHAVVLSSSSRAGRITSISTTAVNVSLKNLSGTAADGDFHLLVFGGMASSEIGD